MSTVSNTAQQPNRSVLLGASNLTLAWPRVVRLMRQRFAAPLEIYTAHGMGRSYCGERSRFGVRELPGILNSGLWQNLPACGEGQRPAVLITDLGNDLVFGKSPAEIVAAVEECVCRLRAWNSNCRIVITRPPLDSVNGLGWVRFRFFRTVLFPQSGLQLPRIRAATAELDRLIIETGDRLSLNVFRPELSSYGLDPIHIRRRHQTDAFQKMMELWQMEPDGSDQAAGSLKSLPTAETRWVLGRERRTSQPVASHLGTSVFAY